MRTGYFPLDRQVTRTRIRKTVPMFECELVFDLLKSSSYLPNLNLQVLWRTALFAEFDCHRLNSAIVNNR